MISPDAGWLVLLMAIAWSASIMSVLRLRQEDEEAIKDRRWREALGHVHSGRMSMETLIRKSVQGRIGRP